MNNKITIITGGQTGVDRAALLFCHKNNINYSGWCPKGQLAEDGRIPEKFSLKEDSSTDYNSRTEKNIEASDLTIVLYDKSGIDKGTKYTIDYCNKTEKKCYQINMDDNPNLLMINKLLDKDSCLSINIAGPRESNSEGIFNKTLIFLEQHFSKLKN